MSIRQGQEEKTAGKTRANRPDTRLAEVCKKLSRLLRDVPVLWELSDLAVGVAASFIKARETGYQDRLEPLPSEYYEKLAERVTRMADGTLPPHGRWISGYYFNSGLMRLGAARDQLRRLEVKLAKQHPDLDVLVGDDELHDEANRLHLPTQVARNHFSDSTNGPIGDKPQ